MKGLVVGKFAPLHRGHHELLDRAEKECSSLHIISYSNPEYWHCEPHRRYEWLRTYYPKARITVIDGTLVYDTHKTTWLKTAPPWNFAPDHEQQAYFIWLLNTMNVEFDVIYGSEPYIQAIAEQTATEARQFALRIPCISATDIRNGKISPWIVCRPQVAAAMVCRVAIIGAESTGKSTLAKALAAKYRTEYVEEYGRIHYERHSGISHPDELLQIAETQLRMEHSAAFNACSYLFCDTTPLTTKMYSSLMFGEVSSELRRVSDSHYDVMILCNPDIPFVQDGTRLDTETRINMHRFYHQAFNGFKGLKYLAMGSVEKRVDQFYDNVVCFRPPFRPSQHHSSL